MPVRRIQGRAEASRGAAAGHGSRRHRRMCAWRASISRGRSGGPAALAAH